MEITKVEITKVEITKVEITKKLKIQYLLSVEMIDQLVHNAHIF